MEALGALAVIAIPAGIFLGLLYTLSPLIIMWQLGGVKQRIDRQRSEEIKRLESISEELVRQNILSRQLLKAYGHDPEA
jgi:hypothetical protein